MTNERTQAIELANRLLDEPNCDPDDDLRMLSRHLLRCCEEIDKYKAWAAACDPAPVEPSADSTPLERAFSKEPERSIVDDALRTLNRT